MLKRGQVPYAGMGLKVIQREGARVVIMEGSGSGLIGLYVDKITKIIRVYLRKLQQLKSKRINNTMLNYRQYQHSHSHSHSY